jgi:hypothetical protein
MMLIQINMINLEVLSNCEHLLGTGNSRRGL